LKPNPEKAIEILTEMTSYDSIFNADKFYFITKASEALGVLRGHELPPEVLAKYVCHVCGVSGVKLWRVASSSCIEGYCSKCGTAQAGLPDTVDERGKIESKFGDRSDKIYSSKKGCGLVPWVIDTDGSTWGYTSVAPQGCVWWSQLPTRKVTR
jgi:hypothetical protein